MIACSIIFISSCNWSSSYLRLISFLVSKEDKIRKTTFIFKANCTSLFSLFFINQYFNFLFKLMDFIKFSLFVSFANRNALLHFSNFSMDLLDIIVSFWNGFEVINYRNIKGCTYSFHFLLFQVYECRAWYRLELWVLLFRFFTLFYLLLMNVLTL